MHTIEIQSCHIVNDVMNHEVTMSAENNLIKKIEVRIPESSYYITNNS